MLPRLGQNVERIELTLVPVGLHDLEGFERGGGGRQEGQGRRKGGGDLVLAIALGRLENLVDIPRRQAADFFQLGGMDLTELGFLDLCT